MPKLIDTLPGKRRRFSGVVLMYYIDPKLNIIPRKKFEVIYDIWDIPGSDSWQEFCEQNPESPMAHQYSSRQGDLLHA